MDITKTKISGLRIGIIVLALATAGIHLALAIFLPDPMFTPLFLLVALGYVALLAAYLLPQLAGYRNLIRWIFMAYVAVAVIGYFIFNASDIANPAGLITKVIEIALIVLLWMDRRNP